MFFSRLGSVRSCFCTVRSYRNRVRNFDHIIDHRIAQARRSLIVQLPNFDSAQSLFEVCQGFGQVHKMYLMDVGKQVALIEFCAKSDVVRMLNSSRHFDNVARHPVKSRHLYFIPPSVTSTGSMESAGILETVPPRNQSFDPNTLVDTVDTSEQIKKFWLATKMTEVDIRLRFFVASIVQEAFSSIFPECLCLPFGSSVSHFGKTDSDLDLVFCFEDYRKIQEIQNKPTCLFLTKKSLLSDRIQAQIYLKVFADVIKHFVPECFQVQIILPAKVPIIRFFHRSTAVWCDVSMSDFTGSYYMSKLFWTIGRMDPRVTPLFFAIRHWAKVVSLTKSSPGPWLTNFQLNLLTLFFLQESNVLPKLKCSASSLDQSEVRIGSLSSKQNSSSLDALLIDFFKFYSVNFDLLSTPVSLYDHQIDGSGTVDVKKNSSSSVMIENPLCRGLCASKNVSVAEIDRFKLASSKALQILSESRPGTAQLSALFNQSEEPSQSIEQGYPDPVHVAPDVDNELDATIINNNI